MCVCVLSVCVCVCVCVFVFALCVVGLLGCFGGFGARHGLKGLRCPMQMLRLRMRVLACKAPVLCKWNGFILSLHLCLPVCCLHRDICVCVCSCSCVYVCLVLCLCVCVCALCVMCAGVCVCRVCVLCVYICARVVPPPIPPRVKVSRPRLAVGRGCLPSGMGTASRRPRSVECGVGRGGSGHPRRPPL